MSRLAVCRLRVDHEWDAGARRRQRGRRQMVRVAIDRRGELMVVPLLGRWIAATFGIVLVLTTWTSVVGTLIVPRPVRSWLTRWVDRTVNRAFRLVTSPIPQYPPRAPVPPPP